MSGRFLARVIDNADPESRDIMDGAEGVPCASARQAWAFLCDLRRDVEDDFPDWNMGAYTDTVGYLDYAATQCEFGNQNEGWPLAADGTGSIVGATPGLRDHDGDRAVTDPGITYEVAAA